MKKVLSLASALALAFVLTACGGSGLTAMDAADYVQGLMDETYLGIFRENYMKSVDITEEEAQANYEGGLEVECEYFTYFFDMNPDYLTQDTHAAILDLLADIYQHSRYQVKAASKLDEGFVVEVVIEPVDIIPLVADNYMEDYGKTFAAAYADTDQADVEAMSAEEQEAFWAAYENDWAMGIVELFRAHMEELGHLAEESIMVQVKPDQKGCYTISDTDFANLDALILAYSYR